MIEAGLIVGWAINAPPRGAAFWSAGAAISYSLYLWHLDLFGLVGNAGIPLAFLVASASYVLFERPVMRWVKGQRTTDHPLPKSLELIPALAS